MKIYNIAIVGGGPGGIAAAVESVILKIDDVILFEKGENHSTTIRKFYKDNKRVDKDYKGQKIDLNGNIYFMDGTKESTLDLFDKILATNNIDVRFKIEIDNISKDGDIFTLRTTGGDEVKAKFVVISIGKMGVPNKPSYPIPLEIRNKVFFNANSINQNEKVLIVGGGNSAVEYAYFLAEKNNVMLNYRKAEFSRINQINKELLDKSIESGKLKTKLAIDIESLDSSNGKPKVNFKDGSSEIFDKIVYAIGGVAPVDFLKKCNLELDSTGVPIVNASCESSVKNIFVAGDLLFKSGGSIASALNNGFDIITEINNRIKQ
ncbi:NAD(P)-binding domain-containing protein [Helicobacter sp. MIT 14-3879]|uniref:NAD(P)-binding domain-containing protein n=1 Tax=Helicobacter sp. MIT 14-3879 TaxID=2040649 RepID=UPI000E1F1922|nr:NAD(P)-binding domain-containing protein [Helicobacter sp. MIT 14-3879]RDU65072.1 cbb3-type cytochrome oxidase assembly protein CcoS [Helicobacter sp. MIT 14-3879]